MFNYKIHYFIKHLNPSGNLVYEYNPLYNYRLTREEDLDVFHKEGSLTDLDTENLNFSLNNPVDILVQPSYDGSVNLILNDGRNIPRLINSRFSVKQNNQYEIVDRIGNNDSNLYDSGAFNLDSSLYKRFSVIPKIYFNKIANDGNLKVGNYTIYIKYADADDNETDFVAESSTISCFIGNDKDPFSINGGYREENSNKSISITVADTDEAYEYVKVYYTKATSDVDQSKVVQAFKVLKSYPINNNTCTILLTGNENISEIPLSEINQRSFIVDSAKAQAVCQNRLFLGNITKSDLMYSDLTDISLHILPYLNKEISRNVIGSCNQNYADSTNASQNFEYYNSKNIYYKVGYWNEEIYRLGIVYILNDGSLSSVYNIRGCNKLPERKDIATYYSDLDFKTPIKDIKERTNLITSDEISHLLKQDLIKLENSKGVIRIEDDTSTSEQIYSIGIAIPKNVVNYLKDKVAGFFFVRQKRIPTVLAQMFTLPWDSVANIPLLKRKNKNGDVSFYAESFLSPSENGNKLNHNYADHLYEIKPSSVNKKAVCGICPDFFVNQPLFNQYFTGTKYPVKKALIQPSSETLISDIDNVRAYYVVRNKKTLDTSFKTVSIIGVGDGAPLLSAGNSEFRGKAGDAARAYDFEYCNKKDEQNSGSKNLVRGIYSPYLGIDGGLDTNAIYNIYQQDYDKLSKQNLFEIRFEDNSAYYSISPRISINNIIYEYKQELVSDLGSIFYNNFYKGDCFICNFTHRLNRNFQDTASPNNDIIVDPDTWATNYKLDQRELFAKINLGDVNAVNLGSWITAKYQSNYNLSLRCLDYSYPSEEAIFKTPRSFYPLQKMNASGEFKIPESSVINKGNNVVLGEQYHFTLPNVPYIKNSFENRIVYSDISITDAFKNGFRSFGYTNFRDYPSMYGGIVKLVEWNGSIICICEHGILLIPVNERTVAGDGVGGNVFINTSNVLPENPKVISDTFGTMWAESVLKTPYYIYGIDTVAKKIWRCNSNKLETISDFSMQSFLNDNLTLTEKEKTPVIGIRNVKTHYNAFKKDVIFTYYDNLHGFEEKVWSLCWNEIMEKWVTFYSWVPSYSENIDNVFFSYNRDTSKWIAKLGTSSIHSSFSDGVVLDENVIYSGDFYDTYLSFISKLYLSNRNLPNVPYEVTYELLEDPLGNYKNYYIEENIISFTKKDFDESKFYTFLYWMEYTREELDGSISKIKCRIFPRFPEYLEVEKHPYGLIDYNGKEVYKIDLHTNKEKIVSYSDLRELMEDPNLTEYHENGRVQWLPKEYQINSERIVQLLNIRAHIYIKTDPTNPELSEYVKSFNNYTKVNAGYYDSVVAIIPEYNKRYLTTDFWKHGFAGNIDVSEEILPTNWYGKQHPFEFEIVVADKPDTHKIFDNLQIISNNAEPESFHYEIIGDCFNFAKDKQNMFIRQEFTKDLYQANGTDISFDNRCFKLKANKNSKSYLFPQYYERQDSYNNIEDYYYTIIDNAVYPKSNYLYKNVAGSEIKYNKTLNEFSVVTHAKALDIKKNGRLRGNMLYKEDKWDIQISPINIIGQSEKWQLGKYPTIILGNTIIPNGLKKYRNLPKDLYNLGYRLPKEEIPDQYVGIDPENWYGRKELKQKDKFIKIRVRYSGKDLATIHALKTLYSISYA